MNGRTVDGARLRLLREKAGLHRKQLAEAIECSYGHLKHVEIGYRESDQLSDVLVHRAARTLGTHLGREVSIDEFTTPTEPQELAS